MNREDRAHAQELPKIKSRMNGSRRLARAPGPQGLAETAGQEHHAAYAEDVGFLLRSLQAAEDENRRLREDLDAVGRIRWFAERMEAVMRSHDGKKSGWDDIDLDYAAGAILAEVWELRDEVFTYLGLGRRDPEKTSPETIIREAADVANFAMMIAEKVRGQKSARGEA